jgi:hypothetical protein
MAIVNFGDVINRVVENLFHVQPWHAIRGH